jgi:ubiquinone/menaquinone biosynthesis C-methylase UbiE
MADMALIRQNADWLLSIIADEFSELGMPDPFRIIDIGCGAGGLMAGLHGQLSQKYPDITIEVYGLEVMEHTGSRYNYNQTTIDNLSSFDCSIDWKDRIFIISDRETWPFEGNYFDCLVSTSVLEHVSDHEKFFAENQRTLTQGGIAIHNFPVIERWKDSGHLMLYFVHRFLDIDVIENYIRFFSKLQIGKYRGGYRKNKLAKGYDVNAYARYQAEYAVFQLNDISKNEALRYAKKHRLQATYVKPLPRVYRIGRKTYHRFLKLFSIVKNPKHRGVVTLVIENIAFWFNIRRGFSVTLILRKRRLQRYGTFVE